MSSIAERFSKIQVKITESCAKARRSVEEVQLLAASKAQPPEAITEAIEAGVTLFGESRVQEARAKIPEVSSRARWHFIGHLQKNKIRHALPLFEMLHSVESLELARDLERIAAEAGERPAVLLEVNLAGEASKFGFRPERLRQELDDLLGLSRLTLTGLMTIPPPAADPEHSRQYFEELRELRNELEETHGIRLPELSMGMSGDYGIAIEEGATFVRIGSELFGPRQGKAWKPQVSDE